MEAIIMSKEQFQEITNQLKEISENLATKRQNSSENFIDNDAFVKLMKVSKRTAQNWRDEGKISFSQIGAKIYYRFSDVEDLLNNHYNQAFERQ